MKSAARFYCEACGLSDTITYPEDEGVVSTLDRICHRHAQLAKILGVDCVTDYFAIRVEPLPRDVQAQLELDTYATQ